MINTTSLEQIDGQGSCYWHTQVETGLRCYACDRRICFRCANRTEVGYTCKDCIRRLRARGYNGYLSDYLVAAAVTFPLSLLIAASFALLSGIGFAIYLAIVAVPATATALAKIVHRSVGRRRSQHLPRVTTGSFVLAVFPFLVFFLASTDWYSIVVMLVVLGAGASTLKAWFHER